MAHCPRCGSALAPGATSCSTCGQAVVVVPPAPGAAAAPAAPRAMAAPVAAKKSSKTPWVIGIVVGCGCLAIPLIGIISAILIPNFLDALEKGRTKRSMGDMRQVATALAAYAADRADQGLVYPEASSMAELGSHLVPDYLTAMPLQDGWKHDYVYQCWNDEGNPEGGCTAYGIASAGRDGSFDHTDLFLYAEGSFEANDYDQDVVVVNGEFIRYPTSPSN